jgi:hypothetical protein
MKVDLFDPSFGFMGRDARADRDGAVADRNDCLTHLRRDACPDSGNAFATQKRALTDPAAALP